MKAPHLRQIGLTNLPIYSEILVEHSDYDDNFVWAQPELSLCNMTNSRAFIPSNKWPLVLKNKHNSKAAIIKTVS